MTVGSIIEIAKICQYLSYDEALKRLYYKAGSPINKDLARKIYTVRKAVEWCNDNDSDNEELTGVANYLYALCGKYTLEAQSISGGGGGVISPTTPTTVQSPLEVLGSDFSSATEWSDSRIESSWNLQVFFNDISRFLDEGTEWTRTSTGIDITISGFDATSNPDYRFFIFIST